MTETALAVITEKNVSQYFIAQGLDPVIEKIRSEVKSFTPDISSAEGRKDIASMAYKVARSKTALDEMGKKLVSGIKEQAKAIDAERSRAWDAIEEIQKEVRKPLTEWEKKEEERVAKHRANIEEYVQAGKLTAENWQTMAPEVMRDRLQEIEAENFDWQEFEALATQAKDQAVASIRTAISRRESYDRDHAELARLKKEESERQQKERDERLQAEAAARAKAEADVAIRAAEERAIRADADRRAAEEKARSDAVAAEEKAKRDAEIAVQRERERAEAVKEAEAEAAAKRENDKKHRAKINNEILNALVGLGVTQEKARSVIEATAKNQIPFLKITY